MADPIAPAEPAEPTPPTNEPGTASGSATTEPEPKVEPKTVPLSELLETRKQLKALQDEKDATNKKQLEEQGKWQELATQNEAKAKDAEARANNAVIQNNVFLEANKLGIIDADAAYRLLNKSGLTVNDDGSVNGVDAALASLIADKPYLVSKGSTTQPIGSGSNPSPDGSQSPTQTTFKKSQLQDPKFFQANKVEIYKALKLGQVVDDTK